MIQHASCPAATITASDIASYGVLDFETLQLECRNGNPASLYSTDGYFGTGFTLNALGVPIYTPDYIAPQSTFVATGFTRFQGNLQAMNHGGTLTVDIESSGTYADFILAGKPGTADADTFAEALASQESTLRFDGAGTLTNNGLVLVDGVLQIGAGITIDGQGSVRMEAGGSAVLSGPVQVGQSIVFGDETGTLTLANVGAFNGSITLYGLAGGDRIDIAGTQVSSVSYDTLSQTLTLLGNGTTLSAFEVMSDIDLTSADFAIGSDGKGGSLLTYKPDVPLRMQESVPDAAVGTTGAMIPLSTLLIQSSGSVPGYSEYILSAPQGPLPPDPTGSRAPARRSIRMVLGGRQHRRNRVVHGAERRKPRHHLAICHVQYLAREPSRGHCRSAGSERGGSSRYHCISVAL